MCLFNGRGIAKGCACSRRECRTEIVDVSEAHSEPIQLRKLAARCSYGDDGNPGEAQKSFCFITRQCEHLSNARIWLPVERGNNACESLGHGCGLRKKADNRFVLCLKVIFPIL